MSILQFRFREQRLMPITWQDRIQIASTEAEVVVAARDFVAQFTPDEINELPSLCRPGKFFDANDITSFAFALVQHHCGDDAKTAKLVQKLATFFSNASIRLSEIMASRNEFQDDSRQSA